MKQFVFALEQVLRFKQRREWLAEVRQKQAASVLQARNNEVTALRDQLTQACAGLPAAVGQAMNAGAWLVGYWQSVRLGQALEAAERLAAQAAKEFERVSAERQQAAKEVEVLLTLRQQRLVAHKQETERARQEQLDEISLRRWMADRQDSGNQAGRGGVGP